VDNHCAKLGFDCGFFVMFFMGRSIGF